MKKHVEISLATYRRLESLVEGFGDTPEVIIARLLDVAEKKVRLKSPSSTRKEGKAKSPSVRGPAKVKPSFVKKKPEGEGLFVGKKAKGKQARPTLVFSPSDEKQFKAQLIETKRAEVILHKKDGTTETSLWNASNFREASNLRGNIWAGTLKKWGIKGIVKAEFSISEDDTRFKPSFLGNVGGDSKQLKMPAAGRKVRGSTSQGFSRGKSKAVEVKIKKKRRSMKSPQG